MNDCLNWIIPTKAPKTNRRHESIQVSIAVRPEVGNNQCQSFHPGSITFCFGRVCGDCVEDVDQDEEESDEESHTAGYDVRRHYETDPGDNNEQSWHTNYIHKLGKV